MTTTLRSPRTVDVFLLRYLDLSSLTLLQKHFALEVRQEMTHRAVLILVEHPVSSSIGTSAEEFQALSSIDSELLIARQSSVVANRPGGFWEHGPGQLGIFMTFSLEKTELSPLSFCRAIENLVRETCVEAGTKHLILEEGFGLIGRTGVVARTAFTVRDSIIQSSIYLNVDHNYRISSRPQNSSLSAESMQRVSLQSLKTIVIERLQKWLASSRISTYTTHHLLKRYRLSELPNLDQID